MSFYETRFPVNISLGSVGGPGWRTLVTEATSGRETRLQKWSEVRNRYDAGYGVRTIEDLQTVLEFFNEMRGKAHGFRFKDWLDYSVTNEALTLDGTSQIQLIKTYGSGFNNYAKDILKPVSGTVTLAFATSPAPSTSLDTTTGIVTVGTIATVSIANVTSSSPGGTTTIETSAAHGRTTGQKVLLSGIGGVTSLNGNYYTITVTDATHFTISADTSAETYTSGGTVSVYPQTGDSVTWSGQFDIPVRFDTDDLPFTLSEVDKGSASIPLIEIRL